MSLSQTPETPDVTVLQLAVIDFSAMPPLTPGEPGVNGGMALKSITANCRTVTSGVSGVCDNDIPSRQKMRGHPPHADPQCVPLDPFVCRDQGLPHLGVAQPLRPRCGSDNLSRAAAQPRGGRPPAVVAKHGGDCAQLHRVVRPPR